MIFGIGFLSLAGLLIVSLLRTDWEAFRRCTFILLVSPAAACVGYDVALSLTAGFRILNAVVWSFFWFSHLINIVAAYHDSKPFALTPHFTSLSRISQRLESEPLVRYYALLLIALLFAVVAALISDALASAATFPNHPLRCTQRWKLVNGRFVSCNPSWGPSQGAPSPSPAPSATPSPSLSPGPAPSPTPSPTPSGTSVAGKITFYAALDNDPAGSRDIAYPGTAPRHSVATTDAGAYSHPITAAVKAGWLKPGAIIYVSELHKYFVVEDSCAGCSSNWVDLYMSNSVQQGVIACEDKYTGDDSARHSIIINPPSTLAVDSALLYTDSAGCAFPAHHYAG